MGVLLRYSLGVHILAVFGYSVSVVMMVFAPLVHTTPAQIVLAHLSKARTVQLVSIPILLLTGLWNTVYNPMTPDPATNLATYALLLATPYGRALALKHVFVFLSFGLTLFLQTRMNRQVEEVITVLRETPAGEAREHRW